MTTGVRVNVLTAQYRFKCAYCSKPIPPGAEYGRHSNIIVCTRHIKWLEKIVRASPARKRRKKSWYKIRCRQCGVYLYKSRDPGEHAVCAVCRDTIKYVNVFTVSIPPPSKNIAGITKSIEDYQGARDW